MAKFTRFDPRNKKQYKKNFDHDKHMHHDQSKKPKYDKLKYYAEDYVQSRPSQTEDVHTRES
jgi:hypothetical protein